MMLTVVAVASLVVGIAIVTGLILWRPKARDAHPHTLTTEGVDVTWTGFDFCEVCGKPSTHELAGAITDHGVGFSAMVATYCAEHAPAEASRVA